MLAPNRIVSLVADLRPTLVPTGMSDLPFGETDLRPNLILLALHAAAAYHGPQTLPATAPAIGWAEIREFDRDNVRGYVYAYGSRAVVAIAGSNDASDWRGNLAICPVPFGRHSEIRVHRGILDHALAVSAALRPLSKLLANRQITFVGHSLGGAVALLLPAIWLAFPSIATPPILGSMRSVTFGAPRVGNAAFNAIRPAALIEQVAADGDPIPHLPIRGPLLGYRHAPGLRYLAADGRLTSGPIACALRIAQATAVASLPGSVRRRVACRLRDAVVAHSIATYLDRLSLPLLGA